MAARAITDPVEQIIATGLDVAGIRYVHDSEGDPDGAALDSWLPDILVDIECKAYHSVRIAEQTARVPDVIVVQGAEAARVFARLISGPDRNRVLHARHVDARKAAEQDALRAHELLGQLRREHATLVDQCFRDLEALDPDKLRARALALSVEVEQLTGEIAALRRAPAASESGDV